MDKQDEVEAALARLSTGSETLDRLLGGGLPAQSLTVLTGAPGTGKTIFAMQVLFNLARAGKRCLYFTTLSEPALKLLRYMQFFTFFDSSLVDENVSFADLGSVLIREGAEQTLQIVSRQMEEEQPDFVVVDSFKAIHDFIGTDTPTGRAAAYNLAVSLAAWGATTLLIGEYTSNEQGELPEFAIADGIIQVSNQPYGLTRVREFEIHKLRGADYIPGRHFFEIGRDGLHFFPRVRSADPGILEVWSPTRVSSGFGGLDEMLRGGLPSGSLTLIEGGTGTGKTLLALGFLLEGARRGEPSVHFGMEERPAQLRGIAASVGWDVPSLEEVGLLRLQYTSPVELSADRVLGEALRVIAETGAKRVVFDSASALEMGLAAQGRFRELLYALATHLRQLGVTSMITMEIAELLGAAQLGGRALSSIADNVVLLRYVEIEGRLERAISVLKARGIGHATELRHLSVGSAGPTVGEPFTALRGVLTGIPQPHTGVDPV